MPKKKDLSLRLEAVIKTLIPQHGQNADDLGPMMRAIKAVHSATDHTSTTPEDLEHQRAAQELFARLVTPSIGIRNDALSVNNIPAEWVSLEHGHDRHHAVLYCHGGGYTCGQLGYARILASKLALCTGFDVLSFEYRLAPENPYPAAVEDALAMWDYLMYMGHRRCGRFCRRQFGIGTLPEAQGAGPCPTAGAVAVQPLDRHDRQRQKLQKLQSAGPDADL